MRTAGWRGKSTSPDTPNWRVQARRLKTAGTGAFGMGGRPKRKAPDPVSLPKLKFQDDAK